MQIVRISVIDVLVRQLIYLKGVLSDFAKITTIKHTSLCRPGWCVITKELGVMGLASQVAKPPFDRFDSFVGGAAVRVVISSKKFFYLEFHSIES